MRPEVESDRASDTIKTPSTPLTQRHRVASAFTKHPYRPPWPVDRLDDDAFIVLALRLAVTALPTLRTQLIGLSSRSRLGHHPLRPPGYLILHPDEQTCHPHGDARATPAQHVR